MNPYDYSPDDARFDLHLRQETPKWSRYAVEFPAAFQTTPGGDHTVHGEYFEPRAEGGAPLVILLHGVGDVSLVPCGWFARRLAGEGIACLVPRLIVHSSRMPGAGWRRMPQLSDDQWFQSYRTSVVEVRQMVDWAGRRAGIDGGRVAVLGVSFGGFISAIAMGVDERITAGVLIVSGGNSGKIVQKAKAGVVRRGYRTTEAEYEAVQREYAAYLAEVEKKGFEDAAASRRSYLNDPMTFSRYLRERSVLMVNARWDEFIPREAAEDLWEASGRPPIVWLPATHTLIWLWYPFIRRRISSFLRSVFGT